ncbi:MAG: SAM-dependent methyltransferase [Micromonosporaceae bacterium]
MTGKMTGEHAAGKDWLAWHAGYDDPDSVLSRRLAVVRERVRAALDACPPGPLKVISICAGQGRDLLGALATHPRRRDVAARLVELDPRNAAVAREAAEAASLRGIEVVVGDASLTNHYAGMVPAHVVLACGLFGNITGEDIERTVGFLSRMCKTGGTVLWTRHRRAPDIVPRLCDWFERSGFERDFVTPPGLSFGVGAHRFTAESQPLEMGQRMFTFIGRERLEQLRRSL